jgi:hypothetical protein
MRTQLIVILLLCFFNLTAQKYFPIKVNKKWGLIDADGTIVLDPVYDAIGEFKHFGFAVMQKNGYVGLLDQLGKEVVKPEYHDLKVLAKDLVAVMTDGVWKVLNMKGKVVLDIGYDRVQVWDNYYLAYMSDGKWGIVTKDGQKLLPPSYDEIQLNDEGYFYTRNGDSWGLIDLSGQKVLDNIAEEIKVYNDSLFFYKQNNDWGAVDRKGNILIQPKYDFYTKLSENFIKLRGKNNFFIYSIPCASIISNNQYDDYYPFSKKYIMTKKDRQLGLIDWCGELVLYPSYHEIQSYGKDLFRVNFNGRWGVVRSDQGFIIPFEYDYIAPLRGKVCVVKIGDLFGVVNSSGEEVVPPQFHRIELENNKGRAYVKKAGGFSEESLTLLEFDEDGKLVDNSNFQKHFRIRIGGQKDTEKKLVEDSDESAYLMDKYEWFYSSQEDRWGLRRLEDGGIQIEPTFHYVKVEKDLGFTLVGIEKYTKYEFERTTYRFEMIYGLVNNDVGLLVTEVDFWDVRFDDFRKDYPLARVVFSNGRHGLVNRIGKIIRKDLAYIGDFKNGVARMSITGYLSGSMKKEHGLEHLDSYLDDLLSTNYMVDYTQYDRIFETDATLICEECEWGYMDTSARVIVPPQYSFARDFVNDVGIVECEGKWGMVSKNADVLIPCRYDGVQFLENTENRIVRVYIQQPKYGLIDTLGQLTVNAVYEEIGSFNEGRLAVKRNGLWGFVNSDGLEVIPCRFRDVQNFSMGLAAVKLGSNWGFIDKQGNIEIDFKFKRAGNFKEGLAWVISDNGSAYINQQEEAIIPLDFDKAFDFKYGVARVVIDGKHGLIDLEGKFIQRPKFSDIQEFDQHQLAIARYGSERVRYGIINLKGDLITNKAYKQIEAFSEGLAVVKGKNGYGFVDTTGVEVISAMYSKAASFSEGRAAVQKNGSCGYIDANGSELINFEFSRCLDFDDGRAVVYKGLRKAGLIDLDGDFVLEPSVNRLLKFKEGRGLVRDEKYRFYYITEQAGLYDGFYQRATEFKHGVAVVQVSGKWGIINQRGIEIIPPKYDKIESFENGYAKVRIKGFNGLSNLKGELIVDPDYEYISYAGEGLFRVEQGDKIGYFDMDGRWVWSLSK